jgi:hypothetical protein
VRVKNKLKAKSQTHLLAKKRPGDPRQWRNLRKKALQTRKVKNIESNTIIILQ